MPTFILRGLDPDFWKRVQTKAAAEGTTVKAVILKLLTAWLGVLTLVFVSACTSASPTAPYPVTVPVVLVPAAITLTGGTATSVDEVLLNLTVTDATGKGVADQVVTLTTTSGTFNHAIVTTTTSGSGQAIITTTEDATVTATLGTLHASARALAHPVYVPPVSVAPPPPPPPVVVPPTPPPPTPAPTLTATLTCTATMHGTATPCNVTASYGGTPLPGTVITNVNWDWADGTALQSTATPINTHNYVQAGTYTVYVLVTANTPDGVRDATAMKVLLIP